MRDSLDFSTAICDPEGQTLAQGVCTPMQLGSFYDAMRKLITQWQGRIGPGDVFIFNDPYAAAGQHLPDIYIAMPIFRGAIGCAPGPRPSRTTRTSAASSPAATRSAPRRSSRKACGCRSSSSSSAACPNQALWDVIALNVRTPDKVLGDLQAQMAACKSAEREMTELFARYGVDTVLAYGEHLQDYAEELTRAEIREIPDGVYRFTDHIDGLGAGPEPIELEVQVTVAGDRITTDWTGSSPQVTGGINPVLSVHQVLRLHGAALGDELGRSRTARGSRGRSP